MLREQARDWLARGITEIEHTISWVNNPVFVAKKSGAIRTCIDCRPANAVTEDLDWALPRLQDLRHAIGGARWYSRIDLKDAFFRIAIPARWRYLTAFESDGIRYQFRRMPFGLKTAPATFQRFMDHVLATFSFFCFWYMDDILIHASTLAELRTRTRLVTRALAAAGCEVNTDKSEYETRGLLFGGLWVYHGGTGPNHAKIAEVLATPCPRTKPEKQSALGLVSYLRDFIPLASMLTADLHEGKTSSLSPERYAEEWGRLLRHIATRVTTLGHWAEEEDADLFTDASRVGAAALLIQDGRIVALASRKLKSAETRYSTTDREHLSLLLAAEKLRVFLHRPKGMTKVWNDHSALLSRNWAEMMPRQARTAEKIQQWIPRLHHVKGLNNPADFFSRWGVEIIGGQVAA